MSKRPAKPRKPLPAEDPLWLAIKRLNRARTRKNKASPKMIAMLEKRVAEEAARVNQLLGGNALEVIEKLAKQASYPESKEKG